MHNCSDPIGPSGRPAVQFFGPQQDPAVTLNKNYVDPSGTALNFYYNTPGAYFVDNGYSSYFSLNSNITTATGLAVEPFIKVYNRMFKNGANTAMDLKILETLI